MPPITAIAMVLKVAASTEPMITATKLQYHFLLQYCIFTCIHSIISVVIKLHNFYDLLEGEEKLMEGLGQGQVVSSRGRRPSRLLKSQLFMGLSASSNCSLHGNICSKLQKYMALSKVALCKLLIFLRMLNILMLFSITCT